jgi:hypothetical protein
MVLTFIYRVERTEPERRRLAFANFWGMGYYIQRLSEEIHNVEPARFAA